MRVVFMGTPDFAVCTFEAILKAGHEIVLAVTQPDRPKGRGKSVSFSPVKEAAMAHAVEVFQPVRVRESECVEHIRQYKPDIIVAAAFGQILPKELLELPVYGCINVHASLLPKYRGASPIQWAVINGDAETGVTIQQMNEGLDTGDVIDKIRVKLNEDETGGSLFDRLAKEGGALCVRVLEAIENGTASYVPQREEDASYVGMISKSLGQICWNKSAVEIERLIRGLNPWPSAFTYLNGKTFKLWKADVLPPTELHKAPGTILEAGRNGLLVQTGHGVLALTEVQIEGKKRMPVDSFLRGYPIEKGLRLG